VCTSVCASVCACACACLRVGVRVCVCANVCVCAHPDVCWLHARAAVGARAVHCRMARACMHTYSMLHGSVQEERESVWPVVGIDDSDASALEGGVFVLRTPSVCDFRTRSTPKIGLRSMITPRTDPMEGATKDPTTLPAMSGECAEWGLDGVSIELDLEV
jgi:hypothetical protein